MEHEPRLPRLQKVFLSEVNVLSQALSDQLDNDSSHKTKKIPIFNYAETVKTFKFLCSLSQELEPQGSKQGCYVVLAKYFFDFFRLNHEEVNSRILLCLRLNPEDPKAIVSLQQFIKLDRLSKGALAQQQKVQILCRLFGLSNPLTVDVNEFLLVLRLFFSRKVISRLQRERVFRGVVDIFKSYGVVSSKRHSVNLSDLKAAMLSQRMTMSLLFRLIFSENTS